VLRQLGFNRIALIAPHKPVYFLDEVSREGSLAAAQRSNECSSSSQPDEMQALGEGPLGSRLLFKLAAIFAFVGVLMAYGDSTGAEWAVQTLALLDYGALMFIWPMGLAAISGFFKAVWRASQRMRR
jgi:hypothetical protein